QRLLHQPIELRITVGTPPSIPRPRRIRRGEGGRAAELLDFFQGRRRVHAGKLCAARACEEAGGEGSSHDGGAASGSTEVFGLEHCDLQYGTVRYSLYTFERMSIINAP